MSTTPTEFKRVAERRISPYLVAAFVVLLSFLVSACNRKNASRPTLILTHAVILTKEARKSNPVVTRKLYRLSVVPGGVYSDKELREARTADNVVAEHYLDFGPSGRDSLRADSLMYVSYRRGDKVFWTAKRHRIPAGEAILTDGTNMARVRCGNRLSLSPRDPVAPQKDPTEIMLGELQPPENDLFKTAGDPALAPPEMDFEIAGAGEGPNLSPFPFLSPNLKVPGIGSVDRGGLPSFFSLPAPSTPLGTAQGAGTPGGGASGGSSSTPVPSDPSAPPETTVAPEPATVMLCLGVLLLPLCLPIRPSGKARKP